MKWVGAFIITAVFYSIGIILARGESDKARAIDSLSSLLTYMKRRISAERTPTFDIFASFSDGFLEERGFLAILRSHRFETANLWVDAAETIPVSGETKTELIRFGAELGSLPLDEQLKRIDSFKEFLEAERASLREALPKKQKSLKAFWLLSGLLTAIILF